jgi:hypothetical protein
MDTLKVKLKLSLWSFLTEHHAMKAYWGSGGIAPRIHFNVNIIKIATISRTVDM